MRQGGSPIPEADVLRAAHFLVIKVIHDDRMPRLCPAVGTNTVDNTIWRLRNKLESDPRHPTYIKTVFRVGYKIEK